MALSRISDLLASSGLASGALVEVSEASDTVTITAITIGAEALDNSFNDSGNGFVTAGFQVDDRVVVSGFATSANNLLVGTVTAVTAGKLTIGGTDGDVIVDEAAGESVTIAKRVSRYALAGDIGALGGGGGSSTATTITEATTAANLLNSNAGTYQRWTATGAKTLTVQPDATEAITQDAEFVIANRAASDNLTIVAGSGVTINAPSGGGLVLEPGMAATLKRVAADTFDLIGQSTV